jgi:hypothetical protein
VELSTERLIQPGTEMQNNTIKELREHLFDALRGLKDGSIKIETAQAMSDVSQTIINSAKMEVDYLKATGNTSAALTFVDVQETDPVERIMDDLPNGITSIVRHRIK